MNESFHPNNAFTDKTFNVRTLTALAGAINKRGKVDEKLRKKVYSEQKEKPSRKNTLIRVPPQNPPRKRSGGWQKISRDERPEEVTNLREVKHDSFTSRKHLQTVFWPYPLSPLLLRNFVVVSARGAAAGKRVF